MTTLNFDHAHPNIFQPTFLFPEFVSTFKKSKEIVDLGFQEISYLKAWQSDWPRTFWRKSGEQDFSQIWDLCKDTSNNINFHYKPNSEKNND